MELNQLLNHNPVAINVKEQFMEFHNVNIPLTKTHLKNN